MRLALRPEGDEADRDEPDTDRQGSQPDDGFHSGQSGRCAARLRLEDAGAAEPRRAGCGQQRRAGQAQHAGIGDHRQPDGMVGDQDEQHHGQRQGAWQRPLDQAGQRRERQRPAQQQQAGHPEVDQRLHEAERRVGVAEKQENRNEPPHQAEEQTQQRSRMARLPQRQPDGQVRPVEVVGRADVQGIGGAETEPVKLVQHLGAVEHRLLVDAQDLVAHGQAVGERGVDGADEHGVFLHQVRPEAVHLGRRERDELQPARLEHQESRGAVAVRQLFADFLSAAALDDPPVDVQNAVAGPERRENRGRFHLQGQIVGGEHGARRDQIAQGGPELIGLAAAADADVDRVRRRDLAPDLRPILRADDGLAVDGEDDVARLQRQAGGSPQHTPVVVLHVETGGRRPVQDGCGIQQEGQHGQGQAERRQLEHSPVPTEFGGWCDHALSSVGAAGSGRNRPGGYSNWALSCLTSW